MFSALTHIFNSFFQKKQQPFFSLFCFLIREGREEEDIEQHSIYVHFGNVIFNSITTQGREGIRTASKERKN